MTLILLCSPAFSLACSIDVSVWKRKGGPVTRVSVPTASVAYDKNIFIDCYVEWIFLKLDRLAKSVRKTNVIYTSFTIHELICDQLPVGSCSSLNYFKAWSFPSRLSLPQGFTDTTTRISHRFLRISINISPRVCPIKKATNFGTLPKSSNFGRLKINDGFIFGNYRSKIWKYLKYVMISFRVPHATKMIF